MDFGGGEEIRFEQQGLAGVVTLTRPAALNALTHRMVKALTAALEAWRLDKSVALVVIKAEGRAFSAGGDILHVYRAERAHPDIVEFFADEYRLNAAIARYPKPYVALIDGIVMGGGVGVSFHGSHRVLTRERANSPCRKSASAFSRMSAPVICCPISAAASACISALTGNRIGYGDALWSGLATHTMQVGISGRPDRAAGRNRRCGSGAARSLRAGTSARPTGRRWKRSQSTLRCRR